MVSDATRVRSDPGMSQARSDNSRAFDATCPRGAGNRVAMTRYRNSAISLGSGGFLRLMAVLHGVWLVVRPILIPHPAPNHDRPLLAAPSAGSTASAADGIQPET